MAARSTPSVPNNKRKVLPYVACFCIACGPLLFPSLLVLLFYLPFHRLHPFYHHSAPATHSSPSGSQHSLGAAGIGINFNAKPGRHDLPPTHLRRLVTPRFFSPRVAPRRPLAPPSGLCIAIPSSPRPHPMRTYLPWHYITQLLADLDRQRAGSPVIPHQMRVVVYSSACTFTMGADMEKAIEEAARKMPSSANMTAASAQQLLKALRKAAKGNEFVEPHLEAVRAQAANLSIPVDVIGSDPDSCQLLTDGPRLLSTVPVSWVGKDGWERWRWRTKLALDFVHVMHQCMATRPRHVLLLQDDVQPTRNWDVGLERFVVRDLRNKPPWSVLSLYYPKSYRWGHKHAQPYDVPCCAQALLFNASIVNELLEFMAFTFMSQPMDHQVKRYLNAHKKVGYVHIPSLFQHLGAVRTNTFKAKLHRDPTYRRDFVSLPYVSERGNFSLGPLLPSDLAAYGLSS